MKALSFMKVYSAVVLLSALGCGKAQFSAVDTGINSGSNLGSDSGSHTDTQVPNLDGAPTTGFDPSAPKQIPNIGDCLQSKCGIYAHKNETLNLARVTVSPACKPGQIFDYRNTVSGSAIDNGAWLGNNGNSIVRVANYTAKTVNKSIIDLSFQKRSGSDNWQNVPEVVVRDRNVMSSPHCSLNLHKINNIVTVELDKACGTADGVGFYFKKINTSKSEWNGVLVYTLDILAPKYRFEATSGYEIFLIKDGLGSAHTIPEDGTLLKATLP